jgi:hypothetical protein
MKAYALMGIRNFNPERFIALAQPMRDSKERITTVHGCVVSHESLGANS